MRIAEQIHIAASARLIYDRYENVDGWGEWDSGVESASVSDGLQVGSMGTLVPTKGPKSKIVITEATNGSSFTTSTKLPMCSLRFAHRLQQSGSGTLVTHEVEFAGPLSPLFGRLIGPQIRKDLPESLAGLKQTCEAAV